MSISHPAWCRHHDGPPMEGPRDLVHQTGDVVLAHDLASGEKLAVARFRVDELSASGARESAESYVVAFGSDFVVLDGRQWTELARQLEVTDWDAVRRQLGEQ